MMSSRKTALSLITATILGVLLLAAPANAVPRAPSGFFGVVPQTNLERSDTARMSRGKIKSVRIPVGWSWIQPESARTFNWDGLDHTVKVAAREGVRVLPFVYSVPPWISPRYTDMPLKNANQLDKWRRFLAAAVERYGPGGEFWKLPENRRSGLPVLAIRRWQIWNEANYYYFSTPVSPRRYARLVRASSNTIKRHDPGAQILLSGLYGTPKGPPSKARDASDFLRVFARYADPSTFDSVALHAYAPTAADLKVLVSGFRRTMVKSGLRRKQMFITEMGWGSGSGNAFLKGSKHAQARELKKAFEYLVSSRRKNNMLRAYWFTWKDMRRSVDTCAFCYSIGLFGPGRKLVAKPAWRTVVKFTRGRP